MCPTVWHKCIGEEKIIDGLKTGLEYNPSQNNVIAKLRQILEQVCKDIDVTLEDDGQKGSEEGGRRQGSEGGQEAQQRQAVETRI